MAAHSIVRGFMGEAYGDLAMAVIRRGTRATPSDHPGAGVLAGGVRLKPHRSNARLGHGEGAKGMASRPKAWSRESRSVLLKWTAGIVLFFLVELVVDYITEGAERITTAYLSARSLVLAFFWLIGAMFIWRWGYIRALRRQNDSNGVEK
ncbi:hypothetical protein ACBR40_33850 [Nonomuraea sp. AD125B]|uniref:hypothetical protein n=1 Tax=Nonomuraea sp. AD125B TaxID=3242897 RepID=UPI0035285A7C